MVVTSSADLRYKEEYNFGSRPKMFAAIDTVSLGKGFGSNGKQHHKHTASETQSHTR